MRVIESSLSNLKYGTCTDRLSHERRRLQWAEGETDDAWLAELLASHKDDDGEGGSDGPNGPEDTAAVGSLLGSVAAVKSESGNPSSTAVDHPPSGSSCYDSGGQYTGGPGGLGPAGLPPQPQIPRRQAN